MLVEIIALNIESSNVQIKPAMDFEQIICIIR